MILRFLFLAFVIYLAYKLVFDFIVPIYRTTRQVKKGFREMHERMNGFNQQQFQQKTASTPTQDNPKAGNSGAGEYIDFEEIKD